ncbi:MAG: DUF2809 domain-containing protein [Janthinobacterium lividum]
MLRFSPRYFLLTVLLLLTEMGIALFMHDKIIRPYAGDFLVVILLYCIVRSLVAVPAGAVVLSVLLFSYLIEIGQRFNMVGHLDLAHSRLARIVLGTSFSWSDMVAYTLGAGVVWAVERYLERKNS